LTLGDARQSTVSISKTLNPEWNETIELPVAGLHSLLLEVVCWDKDRFGKDYMGEFDVSLEDLFTHAVIALPASLLRGSESLTLTHSRLLGTISNRGGLAGKRVL